MPVFDVKSIDKLLTLLQKKGVKSFKLGDLEVTLGDAPQAVAAQKSKAPQSYTYLPGGITEDTQIATDDELTGDALLFYSADAQAQNS